MKVIIAGATGYVGSNVLLRCIKDTSISKIMVLSRRPLTGLTVKGTFLETMPEYDNKVEVILHENWLEYSPELLSRLEGSNGCLWCIGGRHTQTSRWPTLEEYHKVSIDYPISAAKAFSSLISPTPDHNDNDPSSHSRSPVKKFRFVFCGGDATELNPSKKLWIMAETRKTKGRAEKGLYEIADRGSDGVFESYGVRPCGIYPQKRSLVSWVLTTFILPTLYVEELSACMVDIAKKGHEGGRIIVHGEIRKLGRELLRNDSKG